MDRPESVAGLTEALRRVGYLADRGLATTLHVARLRSGGSAQCAAF